MKVFILLACVTAALAFEDRFYRERHNGGYRQLKHPDKRCRRIGQYIPVKHDSCRYLRCDYGDEPWRDENGKISFFTQELWCPPGLSVDFHQLRKPWYTGNPCTVPSTDCTGGRFVHPKPHHYIKSSSYDDSISSYHDDSSSSYHDDSSSSYHDFSSDSDDSSSFSRHGRFHGRRHGRHHGRHGNRHNLRHFNHHHRYGFGTDAGFVRAHKIKVVVPTTPAPVTEAPAPVEVPAAPVEAASVHVGGGSAASDEASVPHEGGGVEATVAPATEATE